MPTLPPEHRQSHPTLLWSLCLFVVFLALVTWLSRHFEPWLGAAVISMLYLLCVLVAAYFSRWWLALTTALLACLLINYFFIEPRYTLQIASLQSWLLLCVFAAVALSVSSTIDRLKQARFMAERAQMQSAFLQAMAETCACCDLEADMWSNACELMQKELQCDCAIVALTETQQCHVLAGSLKLDRVASALQWALDFVRPIGAGTQDWSALPVCVLPLEVGQRQLLCIQADNHLPELAFLRLITHQLAESGRRIRQQHARLQAEQRAVEAEFKKVLLTALSHDMRTPLTALLGAVNVLTDGQIPLDAAQRQALRESIQAESEFLTLATENILTLVMLESSLGLNLDWQSPLDIARHVVQRYQARMQAPIHLRDTTGDALLKVDARLIAHALANLLDNACKYQNIGTAIEVCVEAHASDICLAVINQGPGFPAEFKIDSFGRRAPHQQRGFGLGLMIVQHIVHAHQGQLRLERDAEGATVVRMRFTRPELTI